MNKTIELSPVAMEYYGIMEATEETLTNYGYALLTIAGGDHEISEAEYVWLETYFVELLFIPREISERFRSFDFKNGNLSEILPKIDLESPYDQSILLIYDSMRMAMADEHFHDHEKGLTHRAAELLDIALYKIKAIEDLVRSEFSLIEMRKSLFEVDPDRKPEKIPAGDQVIKHNTWVTMNFGHTYTTYQSLRDFFHLILTISGADGEISDKEMRWLELTALKEGTPETIIDELRKFDYRSANVEDFTQSMVTDAYQNINRICLYMAMHMAAADGHYADEEHRQLVKAARLLEVEEEIILYLEKVVNLEHALQDLKESFFH